ncbi:MAG TPA: FtsQ-type POTRA domain-containing protein, partial [Candidatus Hydrogenedentes bacterium]|nr:FtsQ-type POTRA domain-containing protein [Candidatus Hydrogenedentota bacterium]
MKQDNGGVRVRRGALRQRRRRMFLVGLRLIALFALIAGLGHAFTQYMKESPRFTVKRIEVEGVHALDLESIRQAAGIKESDNLWQASVEDIRRRIEAIPYVKHAAVRR